MPSGLKVGSYIILIQKKKKKKVDMITVLSTCIMYYLIIKNMSLMYINIKYV